MMYRSITVRMPVSGDCPVFRTGFNLLKQSIKMRSAVLVSDMPGDMEIVLGIENNIGREGFRIKRESDRCVRITGNEGSGLLYGIGKFLRSSAYGKKGFQPSEWEGTSFPVKEIRGIYLATHFHNYYHDAPMEKVEQYIGELALWGVNTLCVWFDMHHYKSIDEPDAIDMIARIRKVLDCARRMHMKICLLMIANESFAGSPAELRAQYAAGNNGYIRQLAGHYHVELCPSKPGGTEQLLRWRKEVLLRFSDMKPDYICIWPYDQGGCTCSCCSPWGSNGYLKAAQPVAELARSLFPDVKIVLSTWLFDNFIDGEWKELSDVFLKKPIWVDYLLAEFPEGRLPEVIEKNGLPGRLPCLGFPEISMYGATPWGGFGANPIPEHSRNLWKNSSRYLSGGFPYSEGIFDDINKFIYTRLSVLDNKYANHLQLAK